MFRGRTDRPRTDREATGHLLDEASDGRCCVRVWAPPRQVAFGRRDARESGYSDARRVSEEAGFSPIERDVGGRAVAYTGDTIAFAVATPRTGDVDSVGIHERYGWAMQTIRSALEAVGAEVATGEPPASFCPGDRSIRIAGGGKLSGIAQRVRADAALVAGCLVVTRADASEIASVLSPVYDALGIRFDPDSVGSVAGAGGPGSPRTVAREVESRLRHEIRRSNPIRGASGDDRLATDPTDIVRVGPEEWS